MPRLAFDEVRGELLRVLLSRKCPADNAEKVAYEIARNSLEGVYTHGVNRFPRLVRNIDDGLVNMDASPVKVNGFGAIENHDGGLGLGIVNASFAMGRAMELAREHGIGLVALRNTNHWLRAATYGYQACDGGMAALCFSNTMPNMPTWGALDARIGNNPLCLAFPHPRGAVVVDMAMSQFSYGALESARLAGRMMPYDAGFDTKGELTRDPSEVIRSKRILPAGYWKGAGLSVLLDVFAGCLSLGNTVSAIGRHPGDEHGMSQVFIAVHFSAIAPAEDVNRILDDALADLAQSAPDGRGGRIAWPGQRALQTREDNLKNGIPVDERVWATIQAL
ncbi:MAG TPA: 3-dehydro-L-gulonate 2-dehydrogenase [Candidatus Limnocylindria bacterium]|nr:3-dehydro-L-gulonate 2-dehydrogenase [Candidatus Limnocylindria bacterium]